MCFAGSVQYRSNPGYMYQITQIVWLRQHDLDHSDHIYARDLSTVKDRYLNAI